jgi:hypothetical protein
MSPVQPLAAHDIWSEPFFEFGFVVLGRISFAVDALGAADATAGGGAGAGSAAAPIAGAAAVSVAAVALAAGASGCGAGSAVADGAFEHAVANATASAA